MLKLSFLIFVPCLCLLFNISQNFFSTVHVFQMSNKVNYNLPLCEKHESQKQFSASSH